MNLSDKVINEQGNVATYCAGADSRLRYVGIDGEDKKYLLDGEGGIRIEYIEIEGESEIQIIESNKFIKYLPVEPEGGAVQISLTLTKDIQNAIILFRTCNPGGPGTGYNISSAGMLINKPFYFEDGHWYIITVDNGVIIWNKLEQAE